MRLEKLRDKIKEAVLKETDRRLTGRQYEYFLSVDGFDFYADARVINNIVENNDEQDSFYNNLTITDLKVTVFNTKGEELPNISNYLSYGKIN